VIWTQYSSNGFDLILNPPVLIVPPHDGSWAAWLGGYPNETAYIQQAVTVPANQHYLSYWLWIASEDVCGYDSGGVFVNGATVESYWLCDASDTNGWVKHVVNLTAYAGQTVTIQFKAMLDDSLNSNLFIDSVAFQANPSGENPPADSYGDIHAEMPKNNSQRK